MVSPSKFCARTLTDCARSMSPVISGKLKQPSEPISGSAHDLPFSLPRSLDDAIRELRECEPLVRILGDPFISAYTIVKEAEYEVFLQVISSWEREHLLLNV